MSLKDLREGLRARWADVILDLAESLPTFNSGIIAHFQATRKRQREWSDRDFEESRLPQGAKIRLCSFTLLRLYPLEDLEFMEAPLRRWFPRVWDERSQGESANAESLTGVSWSYVGHVAHKKGGLFSGELAILDDLPPEIEHISIEAQKVLPSLRALAFGVTLSEDVSAHLLKLHSARYLGQITFHRWLPLTRRTLGLAERPPEAAREAAIHSFVEDIRSKAEKFLTRHFPGPSHSGAHRFVALDDFHLSIAKSASPEVESRAAWRRQFGFGSWTYNSFSNGVVTFLPADELSGLSYPHRLIVHGDPQPGDMMNATIANTVHELIPFLAMLDILSGSEDSVGGLRLQVFRHMADRGVAAWFRRRTPGYFFREIRLNSTLQIHRMLLDRQRLEYKQHEDLFGSSCRGLKLLAHVHGGGANLLDSFQATITRKIDLVSEHLKLASESFSGHVSALNVDVTYRLARKIFWLTLIVTVVTALGNGSAVVSGLKVLRRLLFR